jgi:hypothetical protein
MFSEFFPYLNQKIFKKHVPKFFSKNKNEKIGSRKKIQCSGCEDKFDLISTES